MDAAVEDEKVPFSNGFKKTDLQYHIALYSTQGIISVQVISQPRTGAFFCTKGSREKETMIYFPLEM